MIKTNIKKKSRYFKNYFIYLLGGPGPPRPCQLEIADIVFLINYQTMQSNATPKLNKLIKSWNPWNISLSKTVKIISMQLFATPDWLDHLPNDGKFNFTAFKT